VISKVKYCKEGETRSYETKARHMLKRKLKHAFTTTKTYYGNPCQSILRLTRNRLAARDSHVVGYVFADPTNSGDYASHLGIKLLAKTKGIDIFCHQAAKRLSSPPSSIGTWSGLIIGGGGLLQPVFETFWQEILDTGIPFAIFGVGENTLGELRPIFNRDLLRDIAARALAIHVRDNRTYDAFTSCGAGGDVTIGLCPSANLLQTFRDTKFRKSQNKLLHVVHPSDIRLAGKELPQVKAQIRCLATRLSLVYVETDNLAGFNKAIVKKYQSADIVISSRLHGCIFSHSLGQRFIAVSCDMKTQAFVETHVPDAPIVDIHHIESELNCELIKNSFAKPAAFPSERELRFNQLRMKQIIHKINMAGKKL
jgi:hypothetical protein